MTYEEFRNRFQYTPEKDLIGKGGFSKVYKAFDEQEKRWVALKFYEGTIGDKYGIREELNKVIHLAHPNLVRYYDAVSIQKPNVYDEEASMQVGIMEYVNGGDFNHFMKRLPEIHTIHTVLQDILKGLQHLHDNGIIHRDIKPQNLLLHYEGGQWTCKIADFGLAKELDNQQQSSRLLGTVEYMAPEQFNLNKFSQGGQLKQNVDLWSLGVILHEVFTGDLPFGGTNEGLSHQQVMFNIMEKELPDTLADTMEPYRSVIKRCLDKNAATRVQNAADLLGLLGGNMPQVMISHETDLESKDIPKETFSMSRRKLFFYNLIFTPLFGFATFFMYRKKTLDNGTSILKTTLFAYLIWIVLVVFFFVVVWDVV